MRGSNRGVILFNLGGGLLLLSLAGYVGYSSLYTSEIGACSLRYPGGLRYSLSNGQGAPLTPMELQGRSGLDAWGLLENVRVERSSDAPTGSSLRVSFAPFKDQSTEQNRSGIGFVWQPSRIAKAGSACLSYSVFFPAGFDFRPAGYLPGLVSTSGASAVDPDQLYDGFAARIGWKNGGAAGIEVREPGTRGYWQGSANDFQWPTGRWLKIEQEIGLTRSGGTTGLLRMWVDGRLRVQNDRAPLNRNQLSGFTGVIANIGYAKSPAATSSMKVSPFVVQWQ